MPEKEPLESKAALCAELFAEVLDAGVAWLVLPVVPEALAAALSFFVFELGELCVMAKSIASCSIGLVKAVSISPDALLVGLMPWTSSPRGAWRQGAAHKVSHPKFMNKRLRTSGTPRRSRATDRGKKQSENRCISWVGGLWVPSKESIECMRGEGL